MTAPRPTPTSGSAPAAPAIPLNPDGSPSFGSTPGQVPVGGGGSVNIWGLSQYILDEEQKVKKPFYWDDKTTTEPATDGNPAFNNRMFQRANDLPENPGGEEKTSTAPVPTSAEDLMQQFLAMSYNDPTAFTEFQTALAQGPWGSSGMKVTGSFDRATQTALADAMDMFLKTSRSAGVPVSFKQYLLDAAQKNQTLNPPNGGSGAPSSPVLSDPDKLAMYVQKAAQAALGRNLSSGEVNSFVTEFHNQEQQSATNAVHGNGPVIEKNDPRGSAIQFVTGQHQQEYAQQQVKGYADAFLNLFLKGGDQAAPNVNLDPTAVSY